ncbi:MAG: hypothetical protein ACYS76_06875 [Planctomycetota bacterium]
MTVKRKIVFVVGTVLVGLVLLFPPSWRFTVYYLRLGRTVEHRGIEVAVLRSFCRLLKD